MSSRLGARIRAISSRFIRLLVAAAFCAAYLPLPMPLKSHAVKDRSTPFACQDRPCGCSTADQFWKRCCCFNTKQKLEWAKLHSVTPPAYVVATTPKTAEKKDPGGCCAKKESATDSTGIDLEASPIALHDGGAVRCEHGEPVDADSDSTEERKQSKRVLTLMDQRCQGQSWGWIFAPFVVLDQDRPSALRLEPGDWATPTFVERLSGLRIEPPEPPPRTLFA